MTKSSKYNLVVENPQSTVVGEYMPITSEADLVLNFLASGQMLPIDRLRI
jgi:hypothetical protein